MNESRTRCRFRHMKIQQRDSDSRLKQTDEDKAANSDVGNQRNQNQTNLGESEPLFYNYLRPLTSLDEGLYALAYEENVHCLATLVRSFKLIEVYIEHGVTALDSYLRAPRFRATIEELTDEPELDGEAGFADVVGSGVDSLGLSHDESFGVDDLDLNLNKHINLNVSQVEIQSELHVSEEPD
ncbi:hypothetical protein Tco_0725614 [Tanacetum coccineum]|uniref:Uncharacterized protein n=1 Tax=Tanacetum coccineum TaxID=301880 RepID=A0ABQ4YDF8_9ASTR